MQWQTLIYLVDYDHCDKYFYYVPWDSNIWSKKRTEGEKSAQLQTPKAKAVHPRLIQAATRFPGLQETTGERV